MLVTLVASSYSFAETVFIVKKNFSRKNILIFDAHVKDCKLVDPYITVNWFNTDKNRSERLGNLERNHFTPIILEKTTKTISFTVGAGNMVNLRPEEKIGQLQLDPKCKPYVLMNVENQKILLKELYFGVGLTFKGFKLHTMVVDGLSDDGTEYSNEINF